MNRAVYRIIDANFNRAREGLRIAEEFCRFALENQPLAGRCKEIRHRLTSAVMKLDSQKLISARDTENDIGCGMEVAGQMKRDSLEDCVTAGFARTTEALRTIAEAACAIDSKFGGEFEKLRYDCYILEKDISLQGYPALKFRKTRLYCIITVQGDIDALKIARDCAKGGADCLQLRVKNLCDDEFLSLARRFVDLCEQNDVISIINDRADIAAACDADGVHLGQNDLPAGEVRKIQLRPLITGISTHSISELTKAVEQRPHYVGLGSVFPTSTKQVEVCGTEYVSKAVKFLEYKAVEAVAIGGITPENVEKVLKAGAKRIAVSSCVCQAKNPSDVCKKLKEIIIKYTGD
ncbi:MAG: thiamine phosphate synthase [Planctomycetes bacterium]|nr:thiamine phosphate synthase [Planctomycetota bacterium]MBU1518191.1 thiamine phosphate synthase [Planctomycetota bacterium]MBU2458682.1 thiamine phosphate synthase [Planctomycetota bacterium]MBU2597230.1 thiamine phosphate synthase [Planctomycetota bacterium]